MHGRGGKSDSKTRVLDFRHKSLLGKNLMSLSLWSLCDTAAKARPKARPGALFGPYRDLVLIGCFGCGRPPSFLGGRNQAVLHPPLQNAATLSLFAQILSRHFPWESK